MDEATREFLRTIQAAVRDSPDWKASAAWSALNMVLTGGNPATATDWLRQFLRMTPAEQHQYHYGGEPLRWAEEEGGEAIDQP